MKLQTIAYIATIIGSVSTTIAIIALVPTLYDLVFNTQTKNEIIKIIDAEADAVIERDIEKLLSMYSPKAHISDVQSGRVWQGSDEIRERYAEIFENIKYIKLKHINTRISIERDIVVAILIEEALAEKPDGKLISIHGKENGERWTFKK